MYLVKPFLSNSLMQVNYNHNEAYPSPINLSYMWGFGLLAIVVLFSQIITGVLLAMHYNADVINAFSDLEHIMRDVVGGFGLRYLHANGASMFFIVVYLHVARGLYYGSYFQPRVFLWISGVLILFLMMATAFIGYVLPWGQMSFWGATVITNFFSAIPFAGTAITQWLWGGYSVDDPTLNRFLSLHFLVPFIIVGVVGLHLILLHEHGSNNPLGFKHTQSIPFFTYFGIKDLFGFVVFCVFFGLFVVYAPNYLGHSDNYIEALPLVTPAHIVPEWYFLPFYAILRTIPDKLGGVIAMVLAILIIVVLPFFDTSRIRSAFFRPIHLFAIGFFFSFYLLLGWIGASAAEYPFIEFSEIITSLYFGYFFFTLLYGKFHSFSVEKLDKSVSDFDY